MITLPGVMRTAPAVSFMRTSTSSLLSVQLQACAYYCAALNSDSTTAAGVLVVLCRLHLNIYLPALSTEADTTQGAVMENLSHSPISSFV